jgi:hypothetical protein
MRTRHAYPQQSIRAATSQCHVNATSIEPHGRSSRSKVPTLQAVARDGYTKRIFEPLTGGRNPWAECQYWEFDSRILAHVLYCMGPDFA